MKRLLSIFIAMFAIALYSTSCETAGDELDLELSEDLVSEDAPEIISTAPGYERAQIEWTLNNAAGTTVKTCYIYNGDDVTECDYDDCYDPSTNSWSTIIPLSEGNHSITIKSYDSNKSLSGASAATTIYAYGESFAAELGHRLLLSSSYDDTTCTLTFTDDYESTITAVSVKYVTTDSKIFTLASLITTGSTGYGNTDEIAASTDELVYATVEMEDLTSPTLELTDAEADQPVEIITTHKPEIEGALDPVTVSITRATGATQDITYVHVNSLTQLQQYMTKEIEYHSVTMTPGTYYVTAEDLAAGKYYTVSYVTGEDTADPDILQVAGFNNYYDLTGVTIMIEADGADTQTAGGELHALHTMGDDNVIKGLTLIDYGSVDDDPAKGYTNVILDGARNRCENIYTYSLGSKPYGYGECFGKGGTNVTIGHNKHCAWLLRGDDNHIKGCTIVHHAYGHYSFIQGGQNGIIEDCYIEGEVVTVKDITDEKGSGSSADLIDFFTTWLYFLTEVTDPDKGNTNYVLSTGEGGIRTYSSGNTYVNGVYYGTGATTDEDDETEAEDEGTESNSSWETRGGGSAYRSDSSSNGTGGTFIFRNNTLVNTRGPLGLVLAGGYYHTSNITFISSQGGINMRNGSTCRNLKSTVNSTPAIQQPYSTYKSGGRGGNSSNTVDMTIIPFTGERVCGNGIGSAASIHGHSHYVDFYASADYTYDDYPSRAHPIYGDQLYIALGGYEPAIGNFVETIEHETYNNTFNNHTDFILEISPRSHKNTVLQAGNGATVIYGGTNSDGIYCYDYSQSELCSWSSSYLSTYDMFPGGVIDQNLHFNNSTTAASANKVTVTGNGDVFIYGDGNTVTVSGSGKIYVLGNSNTITTSGSNEIIYATQILEHADPKSYFGTHTHAYFPYNYYYFGTTDAVVDMNDKQGCVGDGHARYTFFAPTGNKVNGTEYTELQAAATTVSAPQLFKK